MFADRLNELIQKKQVSKYQIARATGVTEATLSNYTRGKGNPNTSIVKQLADYFEVDFEWLLRGDGKDDSVPTQLSEAERPVYHSDYPEKKQRAASSDLSVLVAFFEKQLAEKDAMIKHLISIVDDKMSRILEASNKRHK